MFDVVIRGGMTVTPAGAKVQDVGVVGERIAALADPGMLPAARVEVDAAGLIVVPGGIDPHVHTGSPVERADGSVDLSFPPPVVSRAAIHGGTTTLIDFAMCRPGMTMSDAIEQQNAAWLDTVCDYSHHIQLEGAIAPDVLAEYRDAIDQGFPTVKVYTTSIKPGSHEVGRTDLGHILALMRVAAEAHGLIVVHAEDDDLVMYGYEVAQRTGATDMRQMPVIHNSLSEDLAFRRIIRLARSVAGAAVYFVHVGRATGVDAIREARAVGQPVYGEVLHHFLCFTDAVYAAPGGVRYHTYPALGSEADRLDLWDALERGTLSTVATDELGTPLSVKLEQQNAATATGGHVGVETRLSVLFTEAVVKRGWSLEQWVAATSTSAARILGLFPKKGVIAVGSDADLVGFDPAVHRSLRSRELHGSDYSIWDGWTVAGWPRWTMLRGSIAVEHGELREDAVQGQLVRRHIAPEILVRPAL